MLNAASAGLVLLIGSVPVSATNDVQPAAAAVQAPGAQRDLARPDMAGCSLPEGWAAIAERTPEFVIFGEFHGTQQSPTFVGRVGCALSASGKKVLLGVEFAARDDPAFQAAWALPHARFADALAEAGWAARRDGVGNKAMFDMLVRLHAQKDAGAAIGIVAFNGAKDDRRREKFAGLPGQGPHEAAQAENIASSLGKSDYDIVLVLVGELHARKRPVGGDAVFEPMAMRLADAGAIVSLRIRSAGGTAWGCQLRPGYRLEPGKPIPADAVDCGDHPLSPDADLPRAPFVSLAGFPDGDESDDDFDGFYWLGTVSSSPPANSGSAANLLPVNHPCRTLPALASTTYIGR